MTNKEMFLRNYQAMIPKLEKLPANHRYWTLFRDQYFPTENVIDDRVKRMILAQITVVMNRTENQTEEEFEDCDCKKKMCFGFHDQDYPVIREGMVADKRLKYTLIDDIKEKYKVEFIDETELDNPLIVTQDIMLGGFKKETRFTDSSREQMESFVEEIE